MTDHVAHENRKQNRARERLGVKLGSNASYVKGHQAMNDDVKKVVPLNLYHSTCYCETCRTVRYVMSKNAIAEGRRLERAAIVADLRKMNQAIYPSARFLADRYERGEHEREGT